MIGLKFLSWVSAHRRLCFLILGAIVVCGVSFAAYEVRGRSQAAADLVNLNNEIVSEKKKLGLTIDDGLIGSMRAEATQVEIMLLERQEWRLVAELLYMRRYERDYLDSLNEENISEHQKYANLFEHEVAQSRFPDSDKQSISQKIKAYRQNFAAVVESKRKIQTLTNDYESKSGKSVAVNAKAENPPLPSPAPSSLPPQKNSGIGKGTLIGFAAVSGMLAILLGFLFARVAYIPVRKMARYMESLAAGNFEEKVPFAGRGGEIGKMASALHIFKGHLFREATHQDDQEEFAEQILENVDVIGEAADQLSSAGNEIRRQAVEVVKVSHSVSDEVAEINSHILGLAGKVDAMVAALHQGNENPSSPASKEKSAQIEELREGANKAVSRILLINDVVMKAKDLSKEIAGMVEMHTSATRDVVRGIKHVAAAIRKRVAK